MSKSSKEELQKKILAMNLGELLEYQKVGSLANRIVSAISILLLFLCLTFPTMLMIIVTSIIVPFLGVLGAEVQTSLNLIQERIDKLDK